MSPAAPGPVRPLSVSETFLSFQGEGPSAGERAVFLRLAGCNLSCAWCDTRYSWDWSKHDRETETRDVDPVSLAQELVGLAGEHARLLVLTGGEPLLQQASATAALEELARLRPHLRCEVETNGTIAPLPSLAARVHRFVVSPKLAHSGLPVRARLRTHVLRAFAALPGSVLKIVAADDQDVRSAAVVAEEAAFPAHRVWIMPLGADAAGCTRRAQDIAPLILARGFNLTQRQHLLLWGDKRGT